MRALMEMKHLGSTLRATVYAPSPQVLGLTESRTVWESSMCVCVCVFVWVWARVCAYSVYMTGWDPGGGSAMWRWPLKGKGGGGRGHLLAGGGEMRVTAIHLYQNTLIPDPICPTPFWDIFSPGDLVTLAVIQLTRPPVHCPYGRLKLQPLTSDHRPLWGTVIHYNTFEALQQTLAVLLCFSFSGFKVIQAPRPYVSDCAISLLAWLRHHM